MQIPDDSAEPGARDFDPHVLVGSEQQRLRGRRQAPARFDPATGPGIGLVQVQPDQRVLLGQRGVHLVPVDRRHFAGRVDPVSADEPVRVCDVQHGYRS